MKKYLMMAAAATVVLASCTKDETLPTPEQVKQEAYGKAFKDAFGSVNGQVNWGFNAMDIVSINKDGEAGKITRGHNVNRNEWGTGNGVGGNVKVPVNVTEDEARLVYNYFNQDRRNDRSAQVNWTDFFISEVWKGTSTYTDGNGNNIGVASDKMNHLQVRKGEGSIAANGQLVGDWEHANDFNNGNQNASWGDITGHTFMNNSGTLEFAYHNTVDSKYHNEYLIVPGATIDASLAGYFYVAFDFYAHGTDLYPANKNMDVERDYIYTDWIVRISPAEFLNAQRVMVEDLIGSDLSNVVASDWDFNDAVFDVAINNEWVASRNDNRLVAHITLYAAGGTRNLTIAGKEVHELFGVQTGTMVNTNAPNGVDNLAPVQFTADLGPADWSGAKHTADEVKVFIGTTELTAVQGKAPQKIVTSTATRWMKEMILITTSYPKFKDYVNSNAPQDWYQTVQEADKLY